MPRQLLLVVLSVALALCACSREAEAPAKAQPTHAAYPFADVTEEVGLRFVHTNGMAGEYYFSEVIGPGIAILDYDNDGRPDILVLQGTPLGGADAKTTACSARLYHNELVIDPDGTRRLKFTDVTEQSGLCSRGYGMGIAVGVWVRLGERVGLTL